MLWIQQRLRKRGGVTKKQKPRLHFPALQSKLRGYTGNKEGLKVALWQKKAQQPKGIIYRNKRTAFGIPISTTHYGRAFTIATGQDFTMATKALGQYLLSTFHHSNRALQLIVATQLFQHRFIAATTHVWNQSGSIIITSQQQESDFDPPRGEELNLWRRPEN